MNMHLTTLLNLAKQKNLKLTPARKQVLTLIAEQKQPLNAYELLDLYRKAQGSGEAMTIYRALDYLTHAKLIHKIHSQNRYTFCDEPHSDSHVQVFICSQCHKTFEFHSHALRQEITHLEKTVGFKVNESTLELNGLCNDCLKI